MPDKNWITSHETIMQDIDKAWSRGELSTYEYLNLWVNVILAMQVKSLNDNIVGIYKDKHDTDFEPR